MTTIFGQAYAGAYDAFYAEKDYDAECDMIEAAFRRHASAPVRTLIDLGCGTGNHALRMARRGYAVTGIDLSAEMLRRAHAKAGDAELAVDFHQGDVRYFDADATFDAALLMFAVLGYQHDDEDVLETFRNIRRHLRPGGLLAFDAWYGPGVLADPPGSRSRTVETDDGPMLRSVTSEMDARRHLCRVHYRLSRMAGGRAECVAEETHVVRYFFPDELELQLAVSGLELVALGDFHEPDREPDERSWNAFGVARAA
ncbi:MAG: class I SAM-dependent methyltransferase [Dehalococcoidia bacterium]|nr:MAG: class I SAM-dependent methyltransferase [Dehalococcoidia bacterium]